jgi:type IV secretory pathway VirB4 component
MSAVDLFHKEFREKRSGFPDLLRYASVVGPGVVQGKGNELMATFKYRGPDMDCASAQELNHLRFRVASMIQKLTGGWMLHSTTLRKKSQTYSGEGYFPDLDQQD